MVCCNFSTKIPETDFEKNLSFNPVTSFNPGPGPGSDSMSLSINDSISRSSLTGGRGHIGSYAGGAGGAGGGSVSSLHRRM
jgi:hypothetical protein